MSDLPGSRRPTNYAAWGLALTLLPMAAGIISQWAVSTEQRRMAETRDIAQDAELAKLRAQVRDIENNRALERQISDLQVSVTGRLAAVETALQGLQTRRR